MNRILQPRPTVLFVCDIQERFRDLIFQFQHVVATSRKVLRAAHILDLPVIVTTQNRLRLGNTVPELTELLALPGTAQTADSKNKAAALVDADKTRFSMCVPEVTLALRTATPAAKPDVVIVGIESHICVTQTTLDLLRDGHRVFVLADGVSSCNAQEVPVALDRLRAAGAVVTTSESWLYEHIGDASHAEGRNIFGLVKQTSSETKAALSSLLSAKF